MHQLHRDRGQSKPLWSSNGNETFTVASVKDLAFKESSSFRWATLENEYKTLWKSLIPQNVNFSYGLSYTRKLTRWTSSKKGIRICALIQTGVSLASHQMKTYGASLHSLSKNTKAMTKLEYTYWYLYDFFKYQRTMYEFMQNQREE